VGFFVLEFLPHSYPLVHSLVHSGIEVSTESVARDRLLFEVLGSGDGQLSPDNNAAENAIRPFVIDRKNWLFSGTQEGTEASALFYSLIETAVGTAKANGLESYKYLCYLFEKLSLAMSEDDSGKLLPQNPNPTPTWISGGW